MKQRKSVARFGHMQCLPIVFEQANRQTVCLFTVKHHVEVFTGDHVVVRPVQVERSLEAGNRLVLPSCRLVDPQELRSRQRGGVVNRGFVLCGQVFLVGVGKVDVKAVRSKERKDG